MSYGRPVGSGLHLVRRAAVRTPQKGTDYAPKTPSGQGHADPFVQRLRGQSACRAVRMRTAACRRRGFRAAHSRRTRARLPCASRRRGRCCPWAWPARRPVAPASAITSSVSFLPTSNSPALVSHDGCDDTAPSTRRASSTVPSGASARRRRDAEHAGNRTSRAGAASSRCSSSRRHSGSTTSVRISSGLRVR